MNNKTATVFGGTGFIGTQIVRELAKKGWTVKVATRIPESAYFLRTCGVVGQVVPFACDYSESKSIAAAVHGADYVVNCIGLLYEKRKGDFERAHVDLAKDIAKACAKENVERFVHVSSLGVNAGSKYGTTKLEGEKAVTKAFPLATILRPSVVFGHNDEFFNMFASLSRIAPVLPLIGGGHTKFQPVYVGDVADAAMAAITLPAVGENDPRGKIFELGGPEVVDFKEVYQRLFKYTGRSRKTMSLPWGIAKMQARILSLLPKPLLTVDQVESLKSDNVVGKDAKKLQDLGVSPTSMDLILPEYLCRFKPGGAFGDKRQA